MIPYGRQDISEEDIAAVVKTLRSDWLTQGPMVPHFEECIAEYCDVPHAVAVNSGTSALHVACMALGVTEGDWVWTVPNTFVASANCAIYCGARVDFVDIDPRTYNMSVAALEAKLREAARQSRLPKVLIPVHFSGQSCDMRAIGELCRHHDVHIIEDASHAIGARWGDREVGSCQYSDITVLSFHPVKIITCGEGGMALTKEHGLANKMRRFRSHGTTRVSTEMQKTSEGPWYYEQTGIGFNYRLTDVQAALGLAQFQRLGIFLARRRELASRYVGLLAELPLVLPWQDDRGVSAWHLYVVQVLGESSGRKSRRREVFESLRASGIGVNVHYVPVHLHPFYRSMGFKSGDFPNAESYYERALSLPMYYALTDEQQDAVVAALRAALRA
jgi:UDP-4-amino-4,6-dideoxy-N-acetyl-beta-L-altrosamine transaminase